MTEGDSVVFVETLSSLSALTRFDVVIGAGSGGGGGGAVSGGGGGGAGSDGGGGGTVVGLRGKLLDVVVKILLLLEITLFTLFELAIPFDVAACSPSISLPFK